MELSHHIYVSCTLPSQNICQDLLGRPAPGFSSADECVSESILFAKVENHYVREDVLEVNSACNAAVLSFSFRSCIAEHLRGVFSIM